MEIRVTVDDEFAKNLQFKLGTKKSTEIARAALTLLNWAVDEVSQGRAIFSGDGGGKDLRKLAMPILDSVRTYRPMVKSYATASATATPPLSAEFYSRDALASNVQRSLDFT
jgi:hypothetical protein